jgi:hypothetical protein
LPAFVFVLTFMVGSFLLFWEISSACSTFLAKHT